jgi:steroid 5-alpha reductase family enzyme
MTARRRLLLVVGAAYLAGLGAAWAVVWLWPGHSPLWTAALADVAATAAVFAFSVGCDNSSLYDPYWSVAPIGLAIYWMESGGPPTPRAFLTAALITAWGARLTYNCMIRWTSLAHEDFRYVEIRGKTGKLYWPASFFSIHLFPTAWVFLGLLPAYAALTVDRPPGPLDAFGALLVAAAIAIETLADRQLRAFLKTRKGPEDILVQGLWGWSRHPNYVGEILFWWGLYALGLAAQPSWWWAGVGPLSITLLFLFVSVPWMERRLSSRHPGRAERVKHVPALLFF